MTDMSIDTETIATDRELVEIETKARANTVMHWPELVRIINRLRKAEAEIERLSIEFQKMTDHLFKARSDALEKAAKRAEEYDGVGSIAAAIRALKEKT
jgi:phosphatidylserine/phosphatidylglycerophosphate/cardiolipin synthase-like enzyme